ncbi:MAG: hypothetical protein Q4G36_04270 [Paracoccus sp. (in: a-proteobacteria)]|nr:hypothetical protein [Paracoccus sp. (in: a-proteobacteria)]
MSRIVFTDLKTTGHSFSVSVERDGHASETVCFEAPSSVSFGNDLIAHSLSTLAARNFSEVHYDFPVSSECLSRIKDFTICLPTSSSPADEEVWRRKEDGVTLSFSGGFDSLAALAIMPKHTKTVTLDFGGAFERERLSFSNFSPITIKTNIVETTLRAGSWSFMGIGAILAAKSTASRFLTFGGIMDQSPEAFYKPSPLIANNTFPAFSACGFISAPYVIGITELGTAKIIAQAYPERARDSLISLADPLSEKMSRKTLLLSYFEKRFKLDLNLPPLQMPAKPPYSFGQAMVVDTMATWFIKNYGADTAEKMVKPIPQEAYKIAAERSLDFFEGYNHKLYENFPAILKPGLYQALERFGLKPYNRADQEDFDAIGDMLANYRPLKGRNAAR